MWIFAKQGHPSANGNHTIFSYWKKKKKVRNPTWFANEKASDDTSKDQQKPKVRICTGNLGAMELEKAIDFDLHFSLLEVIQHRFSLISLILLLAGRVYLCDQM